MSQDIQMLSYLGFTWRFMGSCMWGLGFGVWGFWVLGLGFRGLGIGV